MSTFAKNGYISTLKDAGQFERLLKGKGGAASRQQTETKEKGTVLRGVPFAARHGHKTVMYKVQRKTNL